MTWLVIKTFLGGMFRRLWEALRAAFRWCLGHPKEAAIIMLSVASVWLWRGWDHANQQRDQWHRAHDLRVEAEKLASEAQKALNAKIQSTYKEQADAAQERHDARADRVRSLTGDFILARRLQPGQCAPGGSNPAPAASGAELPAPMSAHPVVVDEPDVRACADASAYALSAYEWANSLIAAGVAK